MVRALPRTASLTLVMALLCAAAPCGAGPNANAKLMIHLTRLDKAAPCSGVWAQPPCGQIQTAGRLSPYYYCPLITTDGDAAAGIGGLECGIGYTSNYPDGAFVGWFRCADYEFTVAGPDGQWPSPGSGLRVTWDTATHCQRYEPGGAGTGVTAMAGAFYIAPYSPTRVSLTAHPVSGVAAVASCAGVADTVEGGGVIRDPSHLGYVEFSADGSAPGYNPCGLVTPVVNTTWGSLKAKY